MQTVCSVKDRGISMRKIAALFLLISYAASHAAAKDPEITFEEFYLDNGLRVKDACARRITTTNISGHFRRSALRA